MVNAMATCSRELDDERAPYRPMGRTHTAGGAVDAVFPPTNKTFAATQSHWFRIEDGAALAMGLSQRRQASLTLPGRLLRAPASCS